MARFSKLDVLLEMKNTGIVPVFYHADPEVAKKVVKACYDGGIRAFEFTNRGEYAHEVFGEVSKYVRDEMPEMIMGVGSVIDAPTAALYMQLGANFIVSPLLNEEMAAVCNRRLVPWMPGCGSLSEISKANELGADVTKVFPGSQVGGPGFVKAIKGPCPFTNIMPTGGVSPTEENLKAWFDAGVFCVGMGSKLITKELVKNQDYAAITENVKSALAIAQKFIQSK